MIKKIVVLSGKGGTGKTTITGALHHLLGNHVLADCDVDASNLHLLTPHKVLETINYVGGNKAKILSEFCIWCGSCENICRFDAVKFDTEKGYFIDPYACEGCKACTYVCTQNCIAIEKNFSGEYYHSQTMEKNAESLDFFHAHLYPGEETSGGLVAEVVNLSMKYGDEKSVPYLLVDGAPGIGCAATSSIVGAYYILIVTEPTESGFHDMKRLIETIHNFHSPFGIVINKWDINPDKTQEIMDFAKKNNYALMGNIPMDEKVVQSTAKGKSIMEEDSPAAHSIREIFSKIQKELKI